MQKQRKIESAPAAGGLKAAFNKAARRLRLGILTAAAALSFGMASGAAAQAPTSAPQQPAAVVVTVQPQVEKKADYAFSEERLNAIKTKMRQTQLGRDLLQFAVNQNLLIEMSNSKVMDSDPHDGYTIRGNYSRDRIRLNGEEAKDDEIMLTLAHELRHAWHERVLRVEDLRLEPRQRLIRDRILEADVFAFEMHFGYEHEKATGAKLDLHGDRANPCGDDDESNLCMLSGYAANRDAGLSTSAAYGKLMDRTLWHVYTKDYDNDFIASQDADWQGVIDKPGTGLAWFGVGDKGLTSNADFAAAMKRAATPAMHTTNVTSGLSHWKEADFLSLEKTGGSHADLLRALQVETAKFNKARAAWNLFWKDFLRENPNIKVTPESQPLTSQPVAKPPVPKTNS